MSNYHKIHSPFQPASFYLLGLILISIGFLVLTGCETKTQTTPTAVPAHTLTPLPTVTLYPTSSPTPEALGSPSNPVVIGTLSEDASQQVYLAGDNLARRLSELNGFVVTSVAFGNYKDLLQAIEKGKVHVTWMPPLTYIYASRRGLVEQVLLTNHFGIYTYGAQFMANTSSGFTVYFDPVSGLNSADAPVALKQLDGKRPCWVEPQSPSGYILPASILAVNKLKYSEGAVLQTHTAVIRALYIKGICDYGVSFSLSGDPRTSSAVQQDLPDALRRVVILWRTNSDIPNLNLSMVPGLPGNIRRALINSFTDMAKTSEGKANLSAAAGNYQIDDLKAVPESMYTPLKNALEILKLDAETFIGK